MDNLILKLTNRGYAPLEAYAIARKLSAIQSLEEWAASTPPSDLEEKQGWIGARTRILDISKKSQNPEDAAEAIRDILKMVPGPRANRDRGRLRALNEALDALDKAGPIETDMAIAETPPPFSSTPAPGNPDMRKDKGDAWSPGGKSRIPQDYGAGTTRMSYFLGPTSSEPFPGINKFLVFGNEWLFWNYQSVNSELYHKMFPGGEFEGIDIDSYNTDDEKDIAPSHGDVAQWLLNSGYKEEDFKFAGVNKRSDSVMVYEYERIPTEEELGQLATFYPNAQLVEWGAERYPINRGNLTASYNRWVGGQFTQNTLKEPVPYDTLGVTWNQDLFAYEPFFYDRPPSDNCKFWIDTEGNPYFWNIGPDLRPPHMAGVKKLQGKGITPQVAGVYENGKIIVRDTDQDDLDIASIAFPELDGVDTSSGFVTFNKVANLSELPPAFDARSIFDLMKFVQLKGEHINWEVFKASSSSPDEELDSLLEILTEIGAIQTTDSDELGGAFIVDQEQVKQLLSSSKDKGNGSIPEKGKKAVREASRGLRKNSEDIMEAFDVVMDPDQIDQIPWDRVFNTPFNSSGKSVEKFVLDLVNQTGYFWDAMIATPELHHNPVIFYVAQQQGITPNEEDEVWGQDPRSGEGIASGSIYYFGDMAEIRVYSDKDMPDSRDYEWLKNLFGRTFLWNDELIEVDQIVEASSDYTEEASNLPDYNKYTDAEISDIAFVISADGEVASQTSEKWLSHLQINNEQLGAANQPYGYIRGTITENEEGLIELQAFPMFSWEIYYMDDIDPRIDKEEDKKIYPSSANSLAEIIRDFGVDKVWMEFGNTGEYEGDPVGAIEILSNIKTSSKDYTEEAKKILKFELEDEDLEEEYIEYYTLLALTKGKDTNLEDVHDAWVMIEEDADHESSIPFEDLDEETQELDRPYVDAIHSVADKIQQVKTAEAKKNGVMVALVPPSEVVEKLKPLTDDPDNLHVTLAFIDPDADNFEVDKDKLLEALKGLIEEKGDYDGEIKLPIKGMVSGFGTFCNDGKHVLWTSVDIPHVDDLRHHLAELLEGSLIPDMDSLDMEHGFTPHMTLEYSDDPFTELPEMPEGLDEVFEWELDLVYGGDWEKIAQNSFEINDSDIIGWENGGRTFLVDVEGNLYDTPGYIKHRSIMDRLGKNYGSNSEVDNWMRGWITESGELTAMPWWGGVKEDFTDQQYSTLKEYINTHSPVSAEAHTPNGDFKLAQNYFEETSNLSLNEPFHGEFNRFIGIDENVYYWLYDLGEHADIRIMYPDILGFNNIEEVNDYYQGIVNLSDNPVYDDAWTLSFGDTTPIDPGVIIGFDDSGDSFNNLDPEYYYVDEDYSLEPDIPIPPHILAQIKGTKTANFNSGIFVISPEGELVTHNGSIHHGELISKYFDIEDIPDNYEYVHSFIKGAIKKEEIFAVTFGSQTIEDFTQNQKTALIDLLSNIDGYYDVTLESPTTNYSGDLTGAIEELSQKIISKFSIAWLQKFAEREDVERKSQQIFDQGGVEFVTVTPDKDRGKSLWEFNVSSTSGKTYPLYGDTAIDDPTSWIDWFDVACSCDWGRWNYDRAPDYRHLERFPCSHAMATEKWLKRNGQKEQDRAIRELETGQGEFRFEEEPETGRRPRPGDVYRQQMQLTPQQVQDKGLLQPQNNTQQTTVPPQPQIVQEQPEIVPPTPNTPAPPPQPEPPLPGPPEESEVAQEQNELNKPIMRPRKPLQGKWVIRNEKI